MAALSPLWARELWGANKNPAHDAGTTDMRKAAGVRTVFRRRRLSDANWPSHAAWKRLNDAVDGNLISLEFPIEACLKDEASTACQNLMSNIHNPYYIGDQPGLTQTLGWVDAWVSKPSVYAVAAKNADHIAAAVNFARENDLRLVLKGGGHSYQGTSNAEDSLLVWTRHMHDITIQEAFVPQGCKSKQVPQRAVTLGAGAIWMQAYNAVTTIGGGSGRCGRQRPRRECVPECRFILGAEGRWWRNIRRREQSDIARAGAAGVLGGSHSSREGPVR